MFLLTYVYILLTLWTNFLFVNSFSNINIEAIGNKSLHHIPTPSCSTGCIYHILRGATVKNIQQQILVNILDKNRILCENENYCHINLCLMSYWSDLCQNMVLKQRGGVLQLGGIRY